MGLLYGIGIRLMNFIIFFLIIILLPLPPKTQFPFKPFNVTPAKELKGSLELNNILDNSERLLEGRVYGPECLISRRNEIYTGIHGGEVIKITADHITHVAKFGQPCEGIFEEAKCGRPLGLAFDTIGNNLIVADAYFGIWQVDLSNGKKKLLISPHQVFDGKIKREAKIFNSIAVDKRGDIYWTDSSSDFTIEDGVMATMANPSGRLFHYDRSLNVSKMLMDELFFANGLVLSPNEEFLIFAETGASRLTKYYIKGIKRGQHEIFLDGLPGLPDNLTPDVDGLWVPLVVARDSENPQIFQIFAPFPTFRMFLLRFFTLLETPFRVVNNAFPNVFTEKVIHIIGHFESFTLMQPKRATILRVDWNGNILGSLHGFDKSAGAVSHVLQLDDSLLLGSPFNKFLAKVKLPKTPQMKIRNVRHEGAGEYMEPVIIQKKIQPNLEAQKPKITTTTTTTTTTTKRPPTTTSKPTTTTAKPTTTTSKPTTSSTTTPKPTKATPTSPKPITQKSATTATPTKSTIPAKPTEESSIPVTTPVPTTVNPKAKKNPAPIIEEIPKDTQPPKPEKLKVIKKGGIHDEI